MHKLELLTGVRLVQSNRVPLTGPLLCTSQKETWRLFIWEAQLSRNLNPNALINLSIILHSEHMQVGSRENEWIRGKEAIFIIGKHWDNICVLLFCFPLHFSVFVILSKPSLREKRHYANVASREALYYITSLGNILVGFWSSLKQNPFCSLLSFPGVNLLSVFNVIYLAIDWLYYSQSFVFLLCYLFFLYCMIAFQWYSMQNAHGLHLVFLTITQRDNKVYLPQWFFTLVLFVITKASKK